MINKVMVILFVAVVVVLSGCSGSKPCHLPVLPYDSGLIGSFKQGEARHWGIFDFGTGSDCVWLVSYDGSSTNCFSLAGEALDVDEWLVKSPPLERLSWRLKGRKKFFYEFVSVLTNEAYKTAMPRDYNPDDDCSRKKYLEMGVVADPADFFYSI